VTRDLNPEERALLDLIHMATLTGKGMQISTSAARTSLWRRGFIRATRTRDLHTWKWRTTQSGRWRAEQERGR
jgi:hypothetical protein